MAFRMLDSRFWLDRRVRGVSVGARCVLAYLLTGPTRTVLPGLVAIGRAGLAEAMARPLSELEPDLSELQRAGLLEIDDAAPLLVVSDAPQWDAPLTKKILPACRRLLRDLPDSPLIAPHVARVRAAALLRCPATDVDAAFSNQTADLDRVSIPPGEAIPPCAATVGNSPAPSPSSGLPSPAPAAAPSPEPGGVSSSKSGESAGPEGPIACPVHLRLSDSQLDMLEMNNGCRREQGLALCRHFAGKWQTRDPLLRERWLSMLWTAVLSTWQNPDERARVLGPAPGQVDHEQRKTIAPSRPKRPRLPDEPPVPAAEALELAIAGMKATGT